MALPSYAAGRTVDVAGYGGVSSSLDARASAAGLQMLMRGGNAVDAAIATAFALTVHEPAMSHLGGQGNMIVHLAGGETTAIDCYACAPGAAHAEMFTWIPSPTQGDYRFATEGDRNTTGALSVAIPGTVCGWVTAHRRWGRLPLADVVAPAVYDARRGSASTARIAAFIAESRDRLARFPETSAAFLHPDGSPKREGDLLLQPGLADTIELIGREGYEPFYSGAVARAIVDCVAAAGGIVAADDLRRYPTDLMWVREPDWVAFKGLRVGCATPSSSAVLLNLLAILDGMHFRDAEPLSAGHLHPLVEAMKLAFAERSMHVGDHTQVNVPLDGLTSPEYAAARRGLIDPARASFPTPGDPWPFQADPPAADKLLVTSPGEPGAIIGTTHHSHVDRWGNMVTMSQSLGDAFGSCVTVPGYGFLLNNAMKLFDPRPGQRAAGIHPYRRPLAPAPTLALRDGDAVLALGSPSGTRILNAIAQVLLGVVEYGMGLQDAVNLPRVHWSGDEFEAEADLPDGTKAALAALGHDVQYRSAKSPWFGAVQVVARDPRTGVCAGAADPRRAGAVAAATLCGPPPDVASPVIGS